MPTLKVTNPGFLTTVQDLGRYGFAHLGVSASGAADRLSLRMGNLLAGNEENAAALEMTLVGGVFEFESDSFISVTGSDFGPTLNGKAVPLWTSIATKAGDRLELGVTKSGARCYFCVHGGILCPPVLGSASTHLLTGIGGLLGRPLKKGDLLEVKALPSTRTLRPKQASPSIVAMLDEQRPLRATIGPQAAYFSQEAQTLLFSSSFSVSEDSNRMGLRLTGPALQRTIETEMLTEGVSLGAVQVPQDGRPIILFVEHQTTGGYPKIANVISADFHRVGQLRPRDEVRFELVTFEQAAALYREQEELIGPHSLTPL